jgi:hypothetical protein
MKRLELKTVIRDDARVLIGQERGVAVREAFGLDALDRAGELVQIVVPSSLRTLTPSFVQGLVAGSVHSLGEDKFFERYSFEGGDQNVMSDIRAGVDRVLTSRHLAGVA